MERTLVRLLLGEQAQHRLRGDEPDVEAVGLLAARMVRAQQRDAGDRLQVAAALVELQLDVAERLEARAEAGLRLADAFRDGADAPAVERVEVQHAVGLTEAKRAQHHRLGGVGAAGHPALKCSSGPGRETDLVASIQMYTTRWCGYCVRAKTLLESRGIEFEEIFLDDDPGFRRRLLDLTGGWTVPQILIDGRPIGGYTELWQLDRSGELERLAA